MCNYPVKSQISVGSVVSIETKENQGNGKLTDGIVSEILTSSESHPYGIKVRLESSLVGRVKKIMPKNHTMSPEIVELDKLQIPKTEDKYNEFKEFFQYDESIKKIPDTPEKSKVIEKIKHGVQERFAQVVCSFGNDYSGGIIYLGIKSNGTISGLEPDRNMEGLVDYDDEFANHIRTVLEKFFDDQVFLASKIEVKFRKIVNKTICLVRVMPSNTPLYLKGEKQKMFFKRGFAPRAEKLEDEAQVRYIRDRFPNFK